MLWVKITEFCLGLEVAHRVSQGKRGLCDTSYRSFWDRIAKFATNQAPIGLSVRVRSVVMPSGRCHDEPLLSICQSFGAHVSLGKRLFHVAVHDENEKYLYQR
jgi:hypothetical protein